MKHLYAGLGDISYSLYVIHFPVLIIIRHFVDNAYMKNGMCECAVVILLTLTAYGLARFYDKPVRAYLALRSRVNSEPCIR